MRIISGQFKGRAIRAPEGRGTRPTSDRTREAMFNVLAHADWSPGLAEARIMDVFAGSGALGFEALSRGAAFCLFVETESAARGAIRDNIEAFNVFGQTRIHRRSALDLGPKPAAAGDPFSIVFMDPPYEYDLTAGALRQLAQGGWITKDALVIAETSADAPAPVSPGWERLDERLSSSARLTFLRRAD
jgi:16S rRNA (guanine966-N2)-methyltransferase